MPDSSLIRERRIGFIGGLLRFFGQLFLTSTDFGP